MVDFLAITQFILSLAGTVLIAVMTYLLAKFVKLSTTSQEARGVESQGMVKALGEVHNLVNSGMTAQLKISSMALRRIANNKNPADPDDLAAADLAEKIYKEHERAQIVREARQGINP